MAPGMGPPPYIVLRSILSLHVICVPITTAPGNLECHRHVLDLTRACLELGIDVCLAQAIPVNLDFDVLYANEISGSQGTLKCFELQGL